MQSPENGVSVGCVYDGRDRNSRVVLEPPQEPNFVGGSFARKQHLLATVLSQRPAHKERLAAIKHDFVSLYYIESVSHAFAVKESPWRACGAML